MDGSVTWGKEPPKKPRPGSGREALARARKAAARSRPTSGQRKSTVAARRALDRSRGRRAPAPSGGARRFHGAAQGAATELRRFSRMVEQKIGDRQRLRHIALAVVGVWAVWTFAIGDGSVTKLWAAKRRNAELDRQIRQISEELTQVKAEILALEGPGASAALEAAGRREHHLIRPGEKLVRFHPVDE